MSFLGRIRVKNRPVAKYLLPTGALVLIAGGYLLWEYGRRSVGAAASSGQEDEPTTSSSALPPEEDTEELTKNIREEEGEGNAEAEEDAVLLLQYNWSGYKKMSDRAKKILEAGLLSDMVSSLGRTLKEEEASKLLSDDPVLCGVLLSSWEKGSFEALRRHDTIIALTNTTSTSQNEDTIPRIAEEVLPPRSPVAPVVENEEENGLDSLGSLQDEFKHAADQAEENARENAAIQNVEPNETNAGSETETATLVIRPEVPVAQSRTEIQGLEGVEETVFERLKTGEGLVITGGKFKNVAGDNWEITYSSDHHRKVAKWYSSTDYRLTHNDISKKRAENTGRWLLESEAFNSWQSDESCQILWCPGIPGVGKTTIASLVVDHFRERCHEERISVGFIYFNYKLQSQQGIQTVLEGLCRQMYELCQNTPIASVFEALHKSHEPHNSRPPLEKLSAALSEASRHFSHYFVVLDALDEYLEIYSTEDIRKLLTTVASLGNMIKLLVTSRFLDGMEALFAEFEANREEIIADDKDMRRYLQGRIGTAGFQFDISAGLSNDIVKKVKEAAGGRFLMAELHMNTLAEQLNRGSLRKALVNLPKGIDATYERVLQRIKTYPNSHRELAMMTLTLVSRAKRRLSVREVQHALATEPGLEDIEDHVTSMSIITSLCAGLVIVRDESVIFVHFTAQDFFDNINIQIKYFPGAEESIFKTCLTYLSLPLCIVTLQGTSRDSTSHLRVIPFLDYALQNLGLHGQGEAASKDLDIFLTSGHVASHLCCIRLLASFTFYYEDLDSPLTTTISPIFLAIYYNRITLLPGLLSPLEKVPLTAKGRTPLMHAARLGRTACLEAMLGWLHAQSGAIGSGLSSDPQGAQEVFLIGDINGRDVGGRTALAHACRQGHKEAVALLLNHKGIDVNLAGNNGRTPLNHAAGKGHEGVVRLLLNHDGIHVNLADNSGRTPLSHAAEKGREGVVGLLLNHEGIDINLAESDGKTPLSYAAEDGHEGVVGLLLNHEGIDVNLAESDGWTPLMFAARYGHEGVVGLLLNHEGIDLNLADYRGWTPLFFAANSCQEAVTKHLLRQPEIQLNRQDTKGASTLTRTITNWDGSNNYFGVDKAKPVIQLLLSRDDLDINLPDNKGHSPLFYAQRAAEEDQRWEEVCELLRAKGMVAVFDWLDVFHDSLFPQLFISSTHSSD